MRIKSLDEHVETTEHKPTGFCRELGEGELLLRELLHELPEIHQR